MLSGWSSEHIFGTHQFLTRASPAPHSRGSLRDPALDRGAIHDYETCAHRALKKQSKTLTAPTLNLLITVPGLNGGGKTFM